MRNLLLITSLLCILSASAQSDSSSLPKPSPRVYTHYDSVYLAKLNSSGNLMIAGGVGLCGAGIYLFYEGWKVYHSAPLKTRTDPAGDKARNQKQGTIYFAASGVAVVAGAVLIGFGARNKVDFKSRKKMMELQSGILDNGNIGLALNF